MDGEEEDWIEYDGGPVQEWHRSARRIRVASGVTIIPRNAFDGCTNLRTVDLSNVITISALAFRDCSALKHVIWTTATAVEIEYGAFFRCTRLKEIDLRSATKIGACAFCKCEALASVAIPPSVTTIDHSAFVLCTNLTKVTICEGTQRIGGSAFHGCEALVQINIPSSVTDIEDEAFFGCNGLVGVELKEGLQRIGRFAFDNCPSLLHIRIPSTTLKIGDHAFRECHQLRSLIGRGTFEYCRSLERITIPSSVTLVGARVFWQCNSLAEVTLCEGVIRMDDYAFNSCPSLARINIPPVAMMIDTQGGSCQLMRTTMPIVGFERKLIVSRWLQYRSPDQLEQAEAKVNEILRRLQQLGTGRLEEDIIQPIREWFAHYDLLDVTTMLELAIWKGNMDDNETGADARQASRRSCGSDMNVIIPCVLEFVNV